jgi:hypothetical protein
MSLQKLYCYWSVGTGPSAFALSRCAASAECVGIHKKLHFLTDRVIEGAECYQAHEEANAGPFRELVYLKAAISKLSYNHYIWIDPRTVFTRSPRNIVSALGRSPIHVPLEVNLTTQLQQPNWEESVKTQCCGWNRFLSPQQYVDLMREAGLYNSVYWGRAAFWIIRREAVNSVCELAIHFWDVARRRGLTVDCPIAVNYAMQMLCANPTAHELHCRRDLWGWRENGIAANHQSLSSGGARGTRESAGVGGVTASIVCMPFGPG